MDAPVPSSTMETLPPIPPVSRDADGVYATRAVAASWSSRGIQADNLTRTWLSGCSHGGIFDIQRHYPAPEDPPESNKLEYRGRFAIALWAVCLAAWINRNRIIMYQARQVEAMA